MPLAEPGWWYREPPTATARALSPLASIWGGEAERRYRIGTAYRTTVPVICVGNFTVGGTGKTPLSLLIAAGLERLGARPAFLTRGYGGRIAGPHWVAPGHDTARDVGDEPLLLAAAAPTMVCRNRAEGARAIVGTGARHGAIVMDDGLQNGTLAKDLTIAVVDGRRGVGNGLVMPAGPLRAPLSFQLGLVDAVLVNARSDGDAASPFAEWLRNHFGGPVIRAATRPAEDTGWVAERPLLAYSGIGAPDRFFALLTDLGGSIAARRVFRDHHAFTETEARQLLLEARRLNAAVCTTEKDWVRLPLGGACGELKSASRVLRIRLELEDRDSLRLKSLIEASLAARRPASA